VITADQVEDLHPGDVVEIVRGDHPQVSVRGPLSSGPAGELWLGDLNVAIASGGYDDRRTHWAKHPASRLTVIARIPRPIYVNYNRTAPVPGDVVRDADDPDNPKVWMSALDAEGDQCWVDVERIAPREKMPARLRLLVDGETGLQVVE
jgi:hypothetical protein